MAQSRKTRIDLDFVITYPPYDYILFYIKESYRMTNNTGAWYMDFGLAENNIKMHYTTLFIA